MLILPATFAVVKERVGAGVEVGAAIIGATARGVGCHASHCGVAFSGHCMLRGGAIGARTIDELTVETEGDARKVGLKPNNELAFGTLPLITDVCGGVWKLG